MNISPINLRDYAKTLGWNLVTRAVEDGLYVLSHPDYSKRQLVFQSIQMRRIMRMQ